MTSSGPVSVVLTCALVLALSPRALAEEQRNDITEEESISLELRRKAIEERRTEIQVFTSRLKEAKTPEERGALIDEFRSRMQISSEQNASARISPQSASQSIAGLRQKIAANPELRENLGNIEIRLRAVEELKAALDAVGKADPKDRARAMAEVSKKRAELMNTQQAGLAEARAISSVAEAQLLPPEMASLREKSEQRKREIEAFKEALKKASPEDRTKLLEQWRARRQEEMNRLLAEMSR